MRAHVLQHVPFEGPGSIGPWLERRGATVTTTRFFEHEPLPEASGVDFVVALGGPMSVNDEARLPWLVAEKRFLRDVIGREIPVLGVCLGAQLIAGSLGARVYPNPQKEIGWFPIATEADALGLRDGLRVFHWHGETFDLPDGAVGFAATPACRHQAFRIGRHVIGLQFHLETTPAGARALVEHCRAELVPGPYVQTERAILAEPAATYAAANRAMAAVLDALVL
jgi:GMP synthase-like glutamine amidotransferase